MKLRGGLLCHSPWSAGVPGTGQGTGSTDPVCFLAGKIRLARESRLVFNDSPSAKENLSMTFLPFCAQLIKGRLALSLSCWRPVRTGRSLLNKPAFFSPK